MISNTTYIIAYYNSLISINEYFRLENNQLVSYFDPEKATLFESTEKANIFIKEYVASDLEFVVKPLEQCVEKYKNKLKEGFKFNTLPLKNKKLSVKYNGESAKKVLDWWIQVKTNSEETIKYEDYKTWPHLYQKFKCLHDIDCFHDYETNSREITFSFRVQPTTTFEDLNKEFNLIKNHITYTDKKGNKIITIIDHQLNQYDSRYLIILPNNKYRLKGRHSIYSEGTFEEVFDFWKTNFYYQ